MCFSLALLFGAHKPTTGLAFHNSPVRVDNNYKIYIHLLGFKGIWTWEEGKLQGKLFLFSKGEFSVLFASLMPQAQPIVFFVVMLSAILGSLSFIYAPKLSTKLAGK